eukprot:317117_1
MSSETHISSVLQIFTLIFLIICSIYLSLCLIWLLYSLFKPHDNYKDSLANFYIYISISCMICSTGTAWSDLWHAIVAYIDDIPMYDLSAKYIMVIANIFYVGTMTAVYLFMIGRVYYTFHNSLFQISQKLTAFYLLLILCNLMIWIIYIIILATVTDFTTAVHLIRHLEIALLIVDFTLNISLMILFVAKLHQLILGSVVSNSKNIPLISTNNKTDIDQQFILDEDHICHLNIISKHTVLCSWAIFLNLIFYGINLFSDFIMTYSPSNDVYQMIYCGRTFGVLINAMVVFFNFKFTKVYYNFFCYLCHVGLNKCFFQWTKRRISRIVSQTL